MKILVTGGAGYLGSVLVPQLLARGHNVRVLDIGYFGTEHIRRMTPGVHLIEDDLRRILHDRRFHQELLDNCDRIIHLAGISNDPSAELSPRLTEEVNFDATVALAEAAKTRRIPLVFSSSCSVYGEADGELTEGGHLNPLTLYASSKARVEHLLTDMADHTWRPVSLRNGTLFGWSPRMRFDLVVNTFVLFSFLHNEIRINGNGLQWRPLLHVEDCARAFIHFTEQSESEHMCYNIAHENLRVVDVAELVKKVNSRLNIVYVPTPTADQRDYRAVTTRMRAAGFRTSVTAERGTVEVARAIASGQVPDLDSLSHWNAKWLKQLMQDGSEVPLPLVRAAASALGSLPSAL